MISVGIAISKRISIKDLKIYGHLIADSIFFIKFVRLCPKHTGVLFDNQRSPSVSIDFFFFFFFFFLVFGFWFLFFVVVVFFLLSPHLCSIIGFIYDLFVARNDSWMS